MDTIYFGQIDKDVEVPLGWYVLNMDESVQYGDKYYNYGNARWERCENHWPDDVRASSFGSACIRDRRMFKNKVVIE